MRGDAREKFGDFQMRAMLFFGLALVGLMCWKAHGLEGLFLYLFCLFFGVLFWNIDNRESVVHYIIAEKDYTPTFTKLARRIHFRLVRKWIRWQARRKK